MEHKNVVKRKMATRYAFFCGIFARVCAIFVYGLNNMSDYPSVFSIVRPMSWIIVSENGQLFVFVVISFCSFVVIADKTRSLLVVHKTINKLYRRTF